VLLLTRHNPLNHQSVLLVCYTSFFEPSDRWDRISPLSIQGLIDKILIEGSLIHRQDIEPIKDFKRSKEYINGLVKTKVYLKENLSIEESKCVHLTSRNDIDYDGFRTIEFSDSFRPGSIVVFQVSVLPKIHRTLINIEQIINQFNDLSSQFNLIIKELTLIDLERVLYRSSLEEQSDGKGFDVYEIPNYGKLIYCGLQGQISLLDKIRSSNELRHPLIVNLKQGNWLMDYISNRLTIYPNTKQVSFLFFFKVNNNCFVLS
jgi:glycogen debranching enzyme